MSRNLKIAISHEDGKHQYNLAYDDLGNIDDPCPVFCVHGLGQTRHTFDVLAAALVEDNRRVIKVDMVGHGQSDWAKDPNRYFTPHYVQDCAQMLKKLNISSVNWLGISLGGLIGVRAIVEQNINVCRFLMVDIAPEVPLQATIDLGEWFAQENIFPDKESFVEWRVENMQDMGLLTDDQRRYLGRFDGRQLSDGRYTNVYDRALSVRMRSDGAKGNAWDDWGLYKKITCPTLVFHGTESPYLLEHHIEKLKTLGPRANVIDIEGVGHYPALSDDYQINVVRKFLGDELSPMAL